jgi:uncharacterized protein YcaQ
MTHSLSKKEARRLALWSQGLLATQPFAKGACGVAEVFEQLRYVQIDTISVVQRAHHHTLWTRLPDYHPDCLHQLQVDKTVFEYWSHAASYLPMDDYRFCLPRMTAIANGESRWYNCDKKVLSYVLDRVTAEGSLQSKDFEATAPTSAHLWARKPAKMALEQLFMEGKLMIVERRGFQKVYDLTERVLPPGVNTKTPSQDEMCRYLITKTIDAHGLVSAAQAAYLRKGLKRDVSRVLSEMEEAGDVVAVSVNGCKSGYFSTDRLLHNVPAAPSRKQLHFLSPFDNAVIQRRRVSELFDFDYQTEIYFPKNKRKYGYFSLPILYGDRLVGRMDPKADRKRKVLVINNLVLEDGVRVTDVLVDAFNKKLQRFATFNGCDAIEVVKGSPAVLIERCCGREKRV